MRRLLAPLSSSLAALALCALSSAQYAGALPPPANLKKGYDAIKIEDAKTILGYLAGPECQGRGTGQPGFQKAAEYVAAQFKAAGLKPLGDDGTYFQNATFYRPAVSDASLTVDGKKIEGASLALAPVAADFDLTGEVVVVRGDAESRLSNEQDEALKDKIVILLTPAGRNAFARQIARSGAKAVLTVVDRPEASTPRASMRRPAATSVRPTGQIARAALGQFGSAVEAFSRQSGVGLLAVPRSARLSGKGKVEEVKVPNVVAVLEGSDPTLKSEYVGIGAHLDHLGVMPDGTVYYGADDDGSGSTAVTLVAKALAASEVKPKRSVVFMAFFGEEMGLLGSKYFVDHSPVPLDKMVAELQMDMVGRDSEGEQNGDPSRVDRKEENYDTIRLVGSKRISTELDAWIQDVNKYVNFRFKYDAEDVYTRSDHYNFAAKGIPIAFLFDGFHPDYHQPTDTVDKINWVKLTNSAKLFYLTVIKVANNPTAPRKDVP